MVALASVLYLVKLWRMPLGGDVTLFSALPICLFSFRRGVKWGLAAGFVHAVIVMLLDLSREEPGPAVYPASPSQEGAEPPSNA